MKPKIKVIFGIQYALLILAIITTLLIGSENAFVLLFGLPPLLLSALLFLVIVVKAFLAKQFKFLLKVLLANFVTLLIGAAAIFFTGRGYALHMLKTEYDTIPCQLISSETVLPDSIQAIVIHQRLYQRKHIFSSDYVQVNQNQWRRYHNGWIVFYRLVLERKTGNTESEGRFEIIGVPQDSAIWMGSDHSDQFDFRDGLIPGDTILLEYISPSRSPDTIMAVLAVTPR